METFFGSSGAQRLFFWSPPGSLRNGDSLLGATLVPIGTETPSRDGDYFWMETPLGMAWSSPSLSWSEGSSWGDSSLGTALAPFLVAELDLLLGN